MPNLIAQGTFALYETDQGGIHITMMMDGETEPRHFDAPPMMVKLMGKKFFGSAPMTNENLQEKVSDVLVNGIVDEHSLEGSDG